MNSFKKSWLITLIALTIVVFATSLNADGVDVLKAQKVFSCDGVTLTHLHIESNIITAMLVPSEGNFLLFGAGPSFKAYNISFNCPVCVNLDPEDGYRPSSFYLPLIFADVNLSEKMSFHSEHYPLFTDEITFDSYETREYLLFHSKKVAIGPEIRTMDTDISLFGSRIQYNMEEKIQIEIIIGRNTLDNQGEFEIALKKTF